MTSSQQLANLIPVLTGAEMLKFKLNSADNRRRCLLGHQRSLLSDFYSTPQYIAARAMYNTLERMVIRASKGETREIPTYNDLYGLSLDELAAFWNKARRRVIQRAWRKGGLGLRSL